MRAKHQNFIVGHQSMNVAPDVFQLSPEGKSWPVNCSLYILSLALSADFVRCLLLYAYLEQDGAYLGRGHLLHFKGECLKTLQRL